MKRWIVLLMTAMFTFPLAACSGGETQETSEQDPADSAQVSEEEVLSETEEEVSMEEETGAEGTAGRSFNGGRDWCRGNSRGNGRY